MSSLQERRILGLIEAHELIGERRKFRKNRNRNNEKVKMVSKNNNTFEGVLEPAGWDIHDNVNQTSLFIQGNEDIMLEHEDGMKKLKHFLNHKVKIIGEVRTDSQNERTIIVVKINRLFDGFTKPLLDDYDEFENMFIPSTG